MGSGSRASAGCGAFGLVGLLISIGIVAWLFVTSTDSITANNKPSAVTTTSPTDAPSPIEVTVTPAADLGTEPDVTVIADGWDPGTDVTVSTCLHGAGLVLGGDSPCDPGSALTLLADETGAVDGQYRVKRIVTAGGLPYDCADDSITCVVQAAGTGSDGESTIGSAAITFRSGLAAPDLLDELGS